jgi:GT2 family glycosyltransferase
MNTPFAASSVGVVIIFGDRDPQAARNLVHTLAAQTRPPESVVLVNFGSPCPLLEKTSTPFPYVYRHLPQGLPWCLPLAKNQGVRLLPPVETVLFLDADILLAPDFIERGLRRLKPGVLLNCRILDLPQGALRPDTDIVRDFPRLKTLTTPRAEITAVGACQWVRMSAFQALRARDEGFKMWGFEDMDFQRRARWLGLESIHLDEETAMLHQWHISKDAVLENPKTSREKAASHWFGQNRKRIRFRAAQWDLCKYDPKEINPDGWGRLP